MKLKIESIARQVATGRFEGEIIVSDGPENRALFTFVALRPFETSREVNIFHNLRLFDEAHVGQGWSVCESMLTIVLIKEIGEAIRFLVSEPLTAESTVGIVSMVNDPKDGLMLAGHRHPLSQSASRVFENQTEILELIKAFQRWCKPIHEGSVMAQ